MTATETPTETAFWSSINERPDDGLRRLVFADWLDEQAGTVECGRCAPPRALPPYHWTCPTCSGTGRVSDGRAELARALRATVDRVPKHIPDHGDYEPGYYWNCLKTPVIKDNQISRVEKREFAKLTGTPDPVYPEYWTYYPAAADAIRDLCRAWIATHPETQS